jgi:hypothetical protein
MSLGLMFFGITSQRLKHSLPFQFSEHANAFFVQLFHLPPSFAATTLGMTTLSIMTLDAQCAGSLRFALLQGWARTGDLPEPLTLKLSTLAINTAVI